MSPRPRVQIPFGGGLDRDKGVMVVDGTTGEDLRNVHLTDGMAFVRKGEAQTAEFLDPDDDAPMTAILAGQVMKVESAGVVVGWRESTRDVHVYRVTQAGASPTHLGVWFTLDASATTPPRIFLAEVAGLMSLAHDEPTISLRATTAYYDPSDAALHVLTASWAHATLIDPAGSNNGLRFQTLAPVGTTPTVTYVDPGSPSASLSIGVVGAAITVNLATDGASAITSTAALIKAAIEASAAASALVTVNLATDEDGSGVVTAVAATAIAGGIRFRGVTEHLGAYLAGWGYGSEAETRPDYVRMSLPGEPTVFHLRYYESIGQKGDPVLACRSTGKTLLCFKALELWEHYGSDRSNFGKEQIDPYVGILASRLGVVVDGVCFYWSHLGPRASNGGAPVDLSIPLALYAPAPDDLADSGDPDYGFAVYLPDRNEIRFHFGERYYAYSTVTKRWAYGELAYEPMCGFLLPGGASADVLAGLAGSLSVTSDTETP